jgi:lipid-A-disaccharide synthase
LLVLFDFEVPYFTKHGLDTEFVGHPLIEECSSCEAKKDNVILLMPGSRLTEVKMMLPIFVEAAKTFGKENVVIPTIKSLEPIIKDTTSSANIDIVSQESEKANLYKTAKLAIVASGTATLQLALSGCPMVVCYKMNHLTYVILKALVKIKYISLVNIILGKGVVPELIQSDCTASKIRKSIAGIDPDSQIAYFKLIREKLINNDIGPSKKISDVLLSEHKDRAV